MFGKNMDIVSSFPNTCFYFLHFLTRFPAGYPTSVHSDIVSAFKSQIIYSIHVHIIHFYFTLCFINIVLFNSGWDFIGISNFSKWSKNLTQKPKESFTSNDSFKNLMYIILNLFYGFDLKIKGKPNLLNDSFEHLL